MSNRQNQSGQYGGGDRETPRADTTSRRPERQIYRPPASRNTVSTANQTNNHSLTNNNNNQTNQPSTSAACNPNHHQQKQQSNLSTVTNKANRETYGTKHQQQPQHQQQNDSTETNTVTGEHSEQRSFFNRNIPFKKNNNQRKNYKFKPGSSSNEVFRNNSANHPMPKNKPMPPYGQSNWLQTTSRNDQSYSAVHDETTPPPPPQPSTTTAQQQSTRKNPPRNSANVQSKSVNQGNVNKSVTKQTLPNTTTTTTTSNNHYDKSSGQSKSVSVKVIALKPNNNNINNKEVSKSSSSTGKSTESCKVEQVQKSGNNNVPNAKAGIIILEKNKGQQLDLKTYKQTYAGGGGFSSTSGDQQQSRSHNQVERNQGRINRSSSQETASSTSSMYNTTNTNTNNSSSKLMTMTSDNSTCNNKSNNNNKSGGLLRLNQESMKLLNQSLQKTFPNERSSFGAGGSGGTGAGGNGGDVRQNNNNNRTSSTDQHHHVGANVGVNHDLDVDFYPAGRPHQMELNYQYAESLADQLNYVLVHHNTGFDHTHSLVIPIRRKLLQFYEQVLLFDLICAHNNRSLQQVWQHCYYQFVDYYRNHVKSLSSSQLEDLDEQELQIAKRYQYLLTTIIAEGTKYFETILVKMRTAYSFTYQMLLERRRHYDINCSQYVHLQEVTYAVKVIYIYLGDLHRYLQCVQSRPKFDLAKQYYLKAHLLVPKNAHSSSQIAIISHYQKNHFDAIYYIIRSCETETNCDPPNPSLMYKEANSVVPPSSKHPSKQMLVVIFDNVKQCFDELYKQIETLYAKSNEKARMKHKWILENHNRINKYYRIEYWVRPSGSIAKCDMYNFYDLAAIAGQTNDTDLLQYYRKEILPNISSENLNHNFVLSFLMTHGMLNCRNGLDKFYDVAKQMLLMFDSLLYHRYKINDEDNGEDGGSGGGDENDQSQDQTKQPSKDDETVHNNNDDSTVKSYLSTVLLVKVFAINMYTVSNTITDEDRYKNPSQYGFTHMNSYHVMSTMMMSVLRRLIELFDVFMEKHHQFEKLHRQSTNFYSCTRYGSHNEYNSDVFEDDPIDIEDLFRMPKTNNTGGGEEKKPTDSDDDGENVEQRKNVNKENDWEDFVALLVVVKLWTDWIISVQPRFPPQALNELTTELDENVWHLLAKFLTLLEKVSTYPVNFYCKVENQLPLTLSPPKNLATSKYRYELVQLPEDQLLDGFKFLVHAPESSRYIRLPYVTDIAHIYMRIASIKLCGDYLCGLQKPYLRFHLKRFESLVEIDDIEGFPGLKLATVQEEAFQQSLNEYIEKIDQYDLIKAMNQCGFGNTGSGDGGGNGSQRGGDGSEVVEEEEEENYDNEQEAMSEINQLPISAAEKRKLLQYRTYRKKNSIHSNYFRLIEHKNEPKRRFVIQPRYAVFDTNCFLNGLDSFKAMLKKPAFVLTIPLIVVHELKFMMARGQTVSQHVSQGNSEALQNLDDATIKRYISLWTKAKDVLEFLHDAFANQRASMRAVTSKGSLLDSFYYDEEFYNPNAVNNDDLILYGCTNLIKHSIEQSTKSMAKLLTDAGEIVCNGDEYVYRDVVLVTDDLNLRLKSLGYDVPVRKLKQFLKWTRAINREHI